METFGNNGLVRLILLFTLSLFLFQLSYSNSLDFNIEEEDDYLTFTYTFIFPDNAPEPILAFEKPQDSTLISVQDSMNRNYQPLVVGDFYRIELEDRTIDNITITFLNRNSYRSIFEDDELYFYINSNVDLTSISGDVEILRSFVEVSEIFPRSYVYDEVNNKLIFTVDFPSNDNLFQIKYIENSSGMSLWLLVLLLIPVIFFVMLFFILKVSPSKKTQQKDLEEYLSDEIESKKAISSNESNLDNLDEKTKKNSLQDKKSSSKIQEKSKVEPVLIEDNINNHEQEETNENIIDSKSNSNLKSIDSTFKGNDELDFQKNIEENQENQESALEEYIQKYLTENEQDVIRAINKNEGIIQQEILDYLPFITKSTLSKIISKLENKKILERVRVGKINKLYLGETLNNLNSDENKITDEKED